MFPTRNCHSQGVLREPWSDSCKPPWERNDICPAYVTVTPGLASASSQGSSLPRQPESNKAEKLHAVPPTWLSSFQTKSSPASCASGGQRHSAPAECFPDFSVNVRHDRGLLGLFSQESLAPNVKNTFLQFNEDCSDDDDDDEMRMVHAKTMPVRTAPNEEGLAGNGMGQPHIHHVHSGPASLGKPHQTSSAENVQNADCDFSENCRDDGNDQQQTDYRKAMPMWTAANEEGLAGSNIGNMGGPPNPGVFSQASLTPKVKNTFLYLSEDCSDDDDGDEIPVVHAKTMPVWKSLNDDGLAGSHPGEQSVQHEKDGLNNPWPDLTHPAQLDGPSCSSLSTTAPLAQQARQPLPAYVRVSPAARDPPKSNMKEPAACMPAAANRANASSSGGVREVSNNGPVHQKLMLERCEERQGALDNFSETHSNPIYLSDSSQSMTMFTVKNTFLDFNEDFDEDEMPMVHTMSCPPEGAMHQIQTSGWVTNSSPPLPTKLSILEQRRQTCPAYVRATPTLLNPPMSEGMQQERHRQPPNLPATTSEPWTAPLTVDHHSTTAAAAAATTASPATASAPARKLDVRQPQGSTGAALHSTGGCMPCPWFWKAQGCLNGEECLRCHLCPEGELKARRRAKTAELRSKQRAKAEETPDQL